VFINIDRKQIFHFRPKQTENGTEVRLSLLAETENSPKVKCHFWPKAETESDIIQSKQCIQLYFGHCLTFKIEFFPLDILIMHNCFMALLDFVRHYPGESAPER